MLHISVIDYYITNLLCKLLLNIYSKKINLRSRKLNIIHVVQQSIVRSNYQLLEPTIINATYNQSFAIKFITIVRTDFD